MKYSRLISVLAHFTLAVLTLAPQKAVAQTSQSTDAAPVVSFTIRLKNGQTQFHQGELITVEMLFSSKIPNTYSLYAGTYDRSGRFEADTFHVDPRSGVADPTAEYFRSGVFGFLGGGLSPGPITLGEKPSLVERDLNELVRFDQPGRYRLSVTNQRVGKQSAQPPHRTVESIVLTSNTIELEILPANPNWQKQKIREATEIIESSNRDSRAACRTLRFLNSAASEAEMIRLYAKGCEGEFRLGLVGSPRRGQLIEAMETQITAAEYPVTTDFIRTLASLVFMNDHREELPPYPANDPEKQKLYQALARRRNDAFQEIFARYGRQTATAAPRKTGPARAVTLDTVVQLDADARGKIFSDSAVIDQLLGSLPELFFDLPTERQYSLLSGYWYRIRTPAMLPVLRQLVAKPDPYGQISLTDLRSVALKRLYQLSPEEGRSLILRQIKSSFPRLPFNGDVLEILPDAELSEVDEQIQNELARRGPGKEFEVIAEYSDLIRRYASANSLAPVKAATENKIGKMSCAPQWSLLVYFLRVDPDYGAAALEQALAARAKGDTGCYRTTLEDVGRKFYSPRLEEIAIQHIDDLDREIANQAIRLLQRKGSAKAEKPLLEHLERWHAEWQTRPAEVQAQIENGTDDRESAQTELQLVQALVSATGWTADADKLKQIEQLCFTRLAAIEIQAARKGLESRTIEILGYLPDDRFPSIHLGHYHADSIDELKQKLAGMPKGSQFLWLCVSPDEEAAARLFQEFKTFLAERGMSLEKAKID